MAHILVVDGDQSSRMIVRTLLEGAGHEVTEAEDGEATGRDDVERSF